MKLEVKCEVMRYMACLSYNLIMQPIFRTIGFLYLIKKISLQTVIILLIKRAL